MSLTTHTTSTDQQLAAFAAAESAGYRALALANGGRAATAVSGAPNGLVAAGDSGSLLPFANMSHVLARAEPGDVAPLVAPLRRFYRAGSGGPYFFWDMWSTLDAGPEGLISAGRPPVMVRRPVSASGLATGLRIFEVHSADRLADFEHVLVDAYPAPMLQPFGSQPRVFTEALLGGLWRMFVGYEDGVAVATAAAIVTDELVLVEAVSTRPDRRGQGYGAALTDAAATCRGDDRTAMLVASDLGRPVYERLGFRTIARATLWMGDRT